MKKTISIVLTTFLIACGGSGNNAGTNPSETVSTKKILASNVVFKDSSSTTSLLVSSANAEEIDTTTKVYAENVILDNADTALVSTNVQDAFVETQPELSQAIIGTWSITSITSGSSSDSDPGFTSDGGTIVFNSDGTVDISQVGDSSPFSELPKIGEYLVAANSPIYTYQIVDNMVLVIKVQYSGRALCSGDCHGETPNNGDSCTCGGDGEFHDVPCYGACSETYGNVVPPDYTSYQYSKYIIYTATSLKINLGSSILSKQ